MTALADQLTRTRVPDPDEQAMTLPSELPQEVPADASERDPDVGALDLSDRHALRRVSGLSTELEDVTEVEYRALRLERVILVGVWTEGTLADAENSLRELSRLAEAARRRIRTRPAGPRRQLAEMSVGGQVQRHQRRGHAVPAVAIAGYTNAGKSSLLNRLTGAGVLVDDSLFATLDPSVRRARTPSGRWFTLTDTVGFVRHLPHQLVEAFRSTLEEVAEADLMLHVVDGSDADPRAQISAVREVLGQIGAAKVPELVVVNHADSTHPT